ncbi:MAG: hypothetical protein ACLR2E_07075 [Lachnospiraceae bacterium]
MGIVAVIVFLYARHRQMMEKRFLNVAFFLILCSLWCIFDSGLYQMYGRQSAAGTLISFYAFMLMSIPMLRFVQNTVRSEVRWIPQIWVFLLYGNTIFAGDLESPVSDPFHTYAVSDTSFIVYRGCFHDPSSLERIPQDRDSGN